MELDGRIKLRHLNCFVAVMQHRNLRRAAESLAVSQPAVSKTLRELEDVLGLRLFERGRRGAAPTREAERLLPHVSTSLATLREGLAEIGPRATAVRTRIAIGALPTLAPSLVPDVVDRLRAAGLPIDLRIETGSNAELLARLREGRLELVLGRLSEPDRMAGLAFEHLFAEPLVLAVRPDHPLAGDAKPSLARVLAHPVVLPLPDTMIRQAADSLLAAHGLGAPPLAVETLSVSLARALAERGAVWFASLAAVQPELRAGRLVRLGIDTAGTEEPVGLVLRSAGPIGPTARRVIAAIREAAAARGDEAAARGDEAAARREAATARG
ncbi:pca operon transcription factor PcaQ [Burkholderiaceae bacterium FT117]|uniref:pca operon transcription factor PcaQ n=1 Tax=Zeimonas sediminis TaxID=2944268 RepID=UPI002342D644|nr:pca operon transcription factor PcaQ [Zeimonas sediminis]MCM5569849.1 pca operon transcription factor PcaQ [Zeimonas sediminis]